MRVAIDAVGRIVVPKPARELLGITGPAELELTVSDGRVELAVVDLPARVEERDGVPLIVTDAPTSPLDANIVRATTRASWRTWPSRSRRP